MSPRNWKFRLEDIRDALSLVEEYVEGVDYPSWTKDRKTVDAVIRNLQIIGEAANHIPSSVQDTYAAIPWQEMKGMRNILVHEYFGVDLDVLWKTVKSDLPQLKVQIDRLLSEVQDSTL